VLQRWLHIFDRGGNGVYLLEYEPDNISPGVAGWFSIRQHGLSDVPLRLDTACLVSEPRRGGCEELLVSFTEPILRSTLTPSSIAISAYDERGVEVDPGSVAFVEVDVGDRDARIIFDPPLANNRRYCIRFVGVADLAGNQIVGPTGRLDLAVLEGDLTGDGRVTVNDAGAMAGLLGAPLDPANTLHARADIDRNGALEMADVYLIVGAIGRDLRTSGVNPCGFGTIASGSAVAMGDLIVDQEAIESILLLIDEDLQSTQTRRPAGFAPRIDGVRRPFVLGVGGDVEDVTRGAIRLDLLVLHGASAEAISEAAEEFGLEFVARLANGPLAGGEVVRLPDAFATVETIQTLALLLEGHGLSCAPVVEDSDGVVCAVYPGVSARLGSVTTPEAMIVLLGRMPCVGTVDVHDATLLRWTCPGWGLQAIEALMRHLSASIEVREAWIELVPLDPGGAHAGEQAAEGDAVSDLELTP
jgi:hypothetical protein